MKPIGMRDFRELEYTQALIDTHGFQFDGIKGHQDEVTETHYFVHMDWQHKNTQFM